MKKVLIISSTPRKNGNSEILCEQFAKGAVEAGNNVENISLIGKKIAYCSGCSYCSSHKGVCSIKDDVKDIGLKMIDADVIVLATPVYFYTMSAQLKTLIDRMCPYYTEMRNKEFYFIVTAADNSIEMMERTIESLRGFSEDCLDNAMEKGTVYGVGAWNVGEIVKTDSFKQAYEMGLKV